MIFSLHSFILLNSLNSLISILSSWELLFPSKDLIIKEFWSIYSKVKKSLNFPILVYCQYSSPFNLTMQYETLLLFLLISLQFSNFIIIFLVSKGFDSKEVFPASIKCEINLKE